LGRKGYRTITIEEHVYEELREYARVNFTSVPRAIKRLIETVGKQEVAARRVKGGPTRRGIVGERA
jgi:predicted CopG family antitoxin